MKERLVELLKKARLKTNDIDRRIVDFGEVNNLADYLIENGVIVPPCKVGDTFYGVNETEYDDYEVLGFKWGKRRGDDEYVLLVLTVYDMEFEWGEEAFLTREEAEQKLKERERE